MSMLSRLATRAWGVLGDIDNPAVPLTGGTLASFLGWARTEAAVDVNPNSAIRVAAVYSCVRIVAEAVATAGFGGYREEETGVRRVRSSELPIAYALEVEPFEHLSAVDAIKMAQAAVELRGEAFFAVERNGRGQPMSLVPIRPGRTMVDRVEGGRLRYRVALDDVGGYVEIPEADMIHLRSITADGVHGIPTIYAGAEAIGLAKAASDYGARYFANDARPSVILRHPKQLSDGAIERLKASWMERLSGGNNHRPVVLEEGLEVETIGVPPDQAQFLETRKMQRAEIAALFGVPLSMLADPDALTRAGSGAYEDLRFSKYAIMPRVRVWENELRRKLFGRGSPYYVAADLEALERAAFKDRVEALRSGVQGAIFTPNEARARLNLPPRAGGDTLFLQQNMAGAEAIANGTAGGKVQNALDGEGDGGGAQGAGEA